MKIEILQDGIWYHGSNKIFSELRTNSTITQWKELAEAFSHQPSGLWYDDNGKIGHNGTEKGYLYIIDEFCEVIQIVLFHFFDFIFCFVLVFEIFNLFLFVF
jgi:hypothetical protein